MPTLIQVLLLLLFAPFVLYCAFVVFYVVLGFITALLYLMAVIYQQSYHAYTTISRKVKQ